MQKIHRRPVVFLLKRQVKRKMLPSHDVIMFIYTGYYLIPLTSEKQLINKMYSKHKKLFLLDDILIWLPRMWIFLFWTSILWCDWILYTPREMLFWWYRRISGLIEFGTALLNSDIDKSRFTNTRVERIGVHVSTTVHMFDSNWIIDLYHQTQTFRISRRM